VTQYRNVTLVGTHPACLKPRHWNSISLSGVPTSLQSEPDMSSWLHVLYT